MVGTLWLQWETRVTAELAGTDASCILFFAWNVAQHVQRASNKMKRSDIP